MTHIIILLFHAQKIGVRKQNLRHILPLGLQLWPKVVKFWRNASLAIEGSTAQGRGYSPGRLSKCGSEF